MGCCSSRQAVIDFYREHPTPSRTHDEDDVPRARAPSSNPAKRPNKPLRPVSPVATCPPERALKPWTRAQLERERVAFFETRVTGDPQVWSGLRIVCDMLRAGDLAGAQTMLDSVGCTCPTGRFKSDRTRGGSEGRRHKGCVFDEKGNSYDIPGWVIADPGDLAVDDETLPGGNNADDTEKDDGLDGGSHDDSHAEAADKDGAEAAGETVLVKARLSDRGTDLTIEVGLHQKVRVLVKRIQHEAQTECTVKLIYLGKELSEAKSLAEQGWHTGHVISVFVFD